MLKYHSSNEQPTRPTKLRFGLLSATEIAAMSVCKVTETTLYYRGLPASGGLLDPLMGSVDRRHMCASCMRDARTCQGHAGHIELSFPVYHIGFIDTVLKTLRTVCFCCSRVCATPEDILSVKDLQGKNRLLAIHSNVRGRKVCPFCNMQRPSFVRVPLGIRVDWPKDMQWSCAEEETYCTQPFTARDAISILKNMTDEDVELIGFVPSMTHPVDMIVQNLVVPPPSTRPAIYTSEGSRSRGQNELTVRLLEVLKRSHEISNALHDETWRDLKTVSTELMERINRLQYEVFVLVNNNVRIQKPSGMGRSGGTVKNKSLTDRLKGKEGRVRGNLMGKRTDFSARCVITPDAYFECDRVGIPYKIAMNLTIPEIVNATNVFSLAKRVRLGDTNVHGAQSIIHSDGTVTNLSNCKKREEINLRIGDVVERFLADDDVVVFNRQPSLHMHGMQSHRVRLMPGHTFRLSLVLAAPYNADFDGDEMNVHVPQSKAASAECAILMAPSQNFIGAQSSKPVMGIVQDSLLGCHFMTQSDIFLSKANFCRIIGTTLNCTKRIPTAAVIFKKNASTTERFWTGKQVFTVLMPKDLFVEPEAIKKGNEWKDEDLNVLVREGQLLCGVLKKAHVGTASGGIIDTLHRLRGGVYTLRFMADIQRVTHAFLLQKGHHVGIKDVLLSEDGQQQVNERLQKVTTLCEDIQREILEAPSDMAVVAENAILRLLSKTLQQTGAIVNEHMSKDNAIGRMVNGGSKGSFINLSQICAALGQQSLEGKRIKFDKSARTLPCFAPNDLSLASRGLVYNSFSLGLSPNELFMHAIGGREGLVDTAVKTSQTGYASRRMNKSMEDHRVYHDCTIRNALDEIISFQWGSDGMHPSRLERINFKLLTTPKEKLKNIFTPREFDLLETLFAELMIVKANVLNTELDQRVLIPFNPARWKRSIRRASNASLDAAVAETMLFDALAKIDSALVKAAAIDVFCYASVKGLTEEQLKIHLDKLLELVEDAKATPGESVGCIAAQSIGEPCTQLTLNSVDWETHMAIQWTGNKPPPCPADTEVGAFIDALMEKENNNVQWHGKSEYLPLPPGSAMALSPDEDGVMKWTELEAVTRHPPINKDGTNTLLRVTTETGHEVVVTKGKSLLVERNGKLVEADGDEVKLGDKVPIVASLPATSSSSCVSLCTLFGPKEVVFTTNVAAAMKKQQTGKRHWWSFYDVGSTLPFSRSDGLLESVRDQPQLLEPGWVTTKIGTVNPNKQNTKAMIPERIPLDKEFGFFLGAYLSEGCVTDHQVHISNVDPDYRKAACEWPNKYGIKYHETLPQHQKKNNGTTISVMFHNTLLVWILERMCGKTSYNKRVPAFAFSAPDAFVKGLLDGYISGDGSINKKQAYMSAVSRSKALRDGISLLLSRFSIPTRLSQYDALNHIHWTTEEDGTRTQEKYGEPTPIFKVYAGAEGTRLFASNVPLTLAYKQERLQEILDTDKNDKRAKTHLTMKDVFLSEITSIIEVESTRESVYDLTVAETRNMTAVNGFSCRDTFHTAGVSTKNVTLGIPRLKELLDASKTPKTPCTTIRFLPEFAGNRSFVEYMSNTIMLTRLGDVVYESNIVLDPHMETTTIEEDRWIVETEQLLHPQRSWDGFSQYVVRLKLHQDLMRSRHLTPPMIRTMLSERLENGKRGNVISSEVNSVNWVIRIRFARVQEMMSIGSFAEDHEAIICHRAANVLLQTVVINGHPEVLSSNVADAPDLLNGQDQFVVHAYGNFLMDCAASHCVDWTRCTSNDIWEVYNTLGIEACTHVLFDQIKTVISFDGTYVDDRHIAMLCDTICRGGNLMPLNRHGINRTDVSPLMRCSFEETTDVLCDAAAFAEHENARGVTTSIMTGQLAELGSGMTKILFPEDDVCITTKSKVRLMRSTCRSFVRQEVAEQLEYVFDDQRPRGSRPLSPPTVVEKDGKTRKRARFRPMSPVEK